MADDFRKKADAKAEAAGKAHMPSTEIRYALEALRLEVRAAVDDLTAALRGGRKQR